MSEEKSSFNSPFGKGGYRGIFLFTAICLLLTNFVHAHFEDLGSSARPIGMGNAFTALANDANTIYYNPAGLAYLKNIQFISAYDRLYIGLTDGSNLGHGFIGFVFPMEEMGGIGLAYINMHLAEYYQEHTLILSYGKNIFSGLSLGANFKFLSKSFGEDEYTRINSLFQEKGYSKLNFSGDLGLLWRISAFSMGLSVTDINQPDLGLADKDIVPLGIKIGFAYRYNFMNFALDAAYKENDWDIYIGVEKWLLEKTVAIRAGAAIGSRVDQDITLGAGYCMNNFEFDYAFVYPLQGIKNTYGSHKVSIIVRFGNVIPESGTEFDYESIVLERVMKEKLEKVRKETEEARKTISSLVAQISDYEQKLKEMEEENKGIRQENEKPIIELENKIEEANKKIAEMKKVIEEKKHEEEKYTKTSPKIIPEPKNISDAKSSRIYTVQKGETLRSIAIKLYNDESRWIEIYELNKDRIIQGAVETGQVLILPVEKNQ